MPGLFVSYRRDDSQGFAGRLADDLEAAFGPERVFRDVEIPIGSDFASVLRAAVADSDALIVVIGRHWVGHRGADRPPRLFDADDWVRAEIEAALECGTWIVPVLVGGAAMPSADALPPSMRRLASVQAAMLDDRRWDADVDVLVAQVRRRLRLPAPAPTPRTRPGPRWWRRLARALGRRLGKGLGRLLSSLAALALVYVGLRLLGDAEVLHMLDAIEVRLLRGWERLGRFLG